MIVFVRGLAWQFSAEVSVILLVEFVVAFMVLTQKNNVMPVWRALIVGLLSPLSLLTYFILENIFHWN